MLVGGSFSQIAKTVGTSYEGPAGLTAYTSAQRVFGTVYQNTGATARYVGISVSNNSLTTIENITIVCDANPMPSTQVAIQSVFINSTGAITFVVPPGYYYSVSVGVDCAFKLWVEWQ